MKEGFPEPTQKEFGEITRKENTLEIRKFGSGPDSKPVGTLTFEEKPRPVRHYYLSDVQISEDELGKGFASQLMAMEKIADLSGLPVVLEDQINETPFFQTMYRVRHGKEMPGTRHTFNTKAEGMYGRRGWTPMRKINYYIWGIKYQEDLRMFNEWYLGLR